MRFFQANDFQTLPHGPAFLFERQASDLSAALRAVFCVSIWVSGSSLSVCLTVLCAESICCTIVLVPMPWCAVGESSKNDFSR